MVNDDFPKIGKVSSDPQYVGRRDAFHTPGIYVSIPLSEFHRFIPGTRVKFNEAGIPMIAKSPKDYHGVIDPFVDPEDLKYTSHVWILFKPGMTSDLTHTFKVEIPSLEVKTPEVRESLEGVCNRCGEEYKCPCNDSCFGCYD